MAMNKYLIYIFLLFCYGCTSNPFWEDRPSKKINIQGYINTQSNVFDVPVFVFVEYLNISSYTDIVRNVCFYIIETWPGNGNQGRDYITEKTLKSILFSKVKSFPILDASNKIMNLMKKDGFWFLNNEFNNITETFKYLKELKNKHKVYALVYEDLLETYGNKLDNNSKILDKLLLKHPKSEYLLKFIKKDLDI